MRSLIAVTILVLSVNAHAHAKRGDRLPLDPAGYRANVLAFFDNMVGNWEGESRQAGVTSELTITKTGPEDSTLLDAHHLDYEGITGSGAWVKESLVLPASSSSKLQFCENFGFGAITCEPVEVRVASPTVLEYKVRRGKGTVLTRYEIDQAGELIESVANYDSEGRGVEETPVTLKKVK